jgi:mannose-6-phosphate isomerase-like protein (cupin superfamily)
MSGRPAAGGGRWVSVSPERLQKWLDGFTSRHGHVTRTFDTAVVRLTAEDGAVAEVEVPFPPLDGALVEHALRDRRVGVLLVRLGGSAVGVFQGPRLVASKVTTRQVHGRSAAGGQSQQRFARRREGQVRVALQAFTDTAVRVLLPEAASLEAVVVGGEIGVETHDENDQILSFVSGVGKAVIDRQDRQVKAGDVVVVPAGKEHNFLNAGPGPLVLYTVYGPPDHADGAVHATREQADSLEQAGKDEPPQV